MVDDDGLGSSVSEADEVVEDAAVEEDDFELLRSLAADDAEVLPVSEAAGADDVEFAPAGALLVPAVASGRCRFQEIDVVLPFTPFSPSFARGESCAKVILI